MILNEKNPTNKEIFQEIYVTCVKLQFPIYYACGTFREIKSVTFGKKFIPAQVNNQDVKVSSRCSSVFKQVLAG